MRAKIISLVILLALAPSLQAQGLRTAWHYIKTHKELLASDAVIIAAWSADAGSSVNTQVRCPTCFEANPLLGHRPKPAATWTVLVGTGAAEVTASHLFWHYQPHYRHVIWTQTAAVAIVDNFVVRSNVRLAQNP